MTSSAPRGRRWRLLLGFLACVAFATAVSLRFYNQQWNGYDDGAYLHIADRMLHGEVLHRDVQDMHLGYVNFLNAGALWLFGNDAVSLRYPLLAMGILSAALAYWLVADAGAVCAAAASVAMTSLSYIQFMNPTANWHCLFLCLVILAVMKWTEPRNAFRHVALGALVMMVVLFRQLSGVFVAAAVLLWLLTELPPRRDVEGSGIRQAWIAKVVLVVTAMGLGVYTFRSAGVAAFLMYGLWPLALLGWGIRRAGAGNSDAARMLLRFSLGAAVAALPLVAYHAYHGSFRPWIDDTVFVTLGFTEGLTSSRLRYWRSVVGGVRAVLQPKSPVQFLTGAFWATAPLLPVLLGAVAVWEAYRPARRAAADRGTVRSAGVGGDSSSGGNTAARLPVLTPLTVLAVFYFLASLHLQKYMYFFFAFPLTFIALAAILPAARPLYRWAGLLTIFGLSSVALLLFAAPFRSIVPGRSTTIVPPSEHRLPRMSLHLQASTVDAYRSIIDLVDREVAPDEPILALPAAPELYYITGRRNPTRFSYSILALHSGEDVAELQRQFEAAPPRLVFYNAGMHYNTERTRELMKWIAERFDDIGVHVGYRVYRSRAPRPRSWPSDATPTSQPSELPRPIPATAPPASAAPAEDEG